MVWASDQEVSAPLPEAAVSALLGLAVGLAAIVFLGSTLAAAAAALFAAVLASAGLRSAADRPAFPLQAFEPAGLEASELLLTDILADERPEPEELLLEDRLPGPDSDSRVIQLFDSAIPTAGELQQRIEHHLRSVDGQPASPAGDDAEALRDAIAELRRSLR